MFDANLTKTWYIYSAALLGPCAKSKVSAVSESAVSESAVSELASLGPGAAQRNSHQAAQCIEGRVLLLLCAVPSQAGSHDTTTLFKLATIREADAYLPSGPIVVYSERAGG